MFNLVYFVLILLCLGAALVDRPNFFAWLILAWLVVCKWDIRMVLERLEEGENDC